MMAVVTGLWEDALLTTYGVTIEPVTQEWRGDAQPHHEGFAGLWPLEGGTRVVLMAKPELSPEQRESFAEWCYSRIGRFLEHGPEPDGWQARSDGGWQMYVGTRILPDMGFLDDTQP